MASSIVTSAAQQLGALVVAEAKFLYDMSDKIERLQHDLQWMQCFLEDADDRQHKEKVVAIWVSEIRDFAYEAEEIVEKYLRGVSHHRKNGLLNTIKWFSCVLCDALALHDVGSNIDSLRTRISELTSRMQMFGIQMISQSGSSIYNVSLREQRRTYAHIEEDPVGLEEDVKEVVDKLVNNKDVNVLGISGMGGLGKTTLARAVFHNVDVRKYFKNNRVWVYISKQFERKDIYQEILIGLSNIGIGKDEESGARMQKIRELPDGELPREIGKILKEKECLVVLDDLWKNRDWDTLKPAFEGIKTSNSKILITTRDGGLIQYAHGYPHIVKLLSEEESRKLLLRTTFTDRGNIDNKETTSSQDSTRKSATTTEMVKGESSTLEVNKIGQTNLQDDDEKAEKEKLGREMLKHCKGLPLAIKALGGLLSTKRTVADWENVRRNITSYLMSDMVEGSDNKELASVLELSYYDLPFYLKPCFMYLGIFPEEYKISVDRLYHLWEAEGLVTTSAYGGDEIMGVALDDIAESFLNQLVKRSMVQVEESWSNGRIKSCRLHDMMRDLCLKKCKEVDFLNTIEHGSSEGPSNQIVSLSAANRKLRRCAIYLKGPGSLLDTSLNNSPCIRSLLVFPHGHKEARELLSGKTLKALSLVRALDLEGTNLIGSGRIRVGNFIHLRYLSIKGAWISDLPSGIWECKYLETLDLRSYDFMELSNKFWKLERLRHLYLPRKTKLRGSKQLILKTHQLQQMETFKNFDPELCKTEDLGKMTNIRVFTICSWTGYFTKENLEGLLESPMIMTKRLAKPLRLQIHADVINGDPTILTTRVPDSCIAGIRIRGPIYVELKDGVQIFPNYLTSVLLESCGNGEEGIQMLEKLPQLKKLDLSGIMTKVSKIRFSKGGFTQLVKLTLAFLDELEELVVEEEGALPNLQYLRIDMCERLKMIPEGLPRSVHIECFPCLKGIEYYNTCPYFTKSS